MAIPTKKQFEDYNKSKKLYELIKWYRNIAEDDPDLHTLRGILTKRETWLLDEIEKIFGINPY